VVPFHSELVRVSSSLLNQAVQIGLIKAVHLDELFTRPEAGDQADGRTPNAERVRHRLDHCPIGRALDGARCDPYVQDRAIPLHTGAGGAWVSLDR
jgi:hypothetical protein